MARIDKRTNGKRLPDEEAQRRFEETKRERDKQERKRRENEVRRRRAQKVRSEGVTTNLGEKLAEALDLGPKET